MLGSKLNQASKGPRMYEFTYLLSIMIDCVELWADESGMA